MRSPRLLLLSLSALALVVGALAPATASGTDGGTISGTVTGLGKFDSGYVYAERVNPNGGSVPTAVVAGGQTYSGGDSFRFDHLRPGAYRLRYLDSDGDNGFTFYPGTRFRSQAAQITVGEGDQHLGLVIPLEPAGRVTGSITLPAGQIPEIGDVGVRPFQLDDGRWVPVEGRYSGYQYATSTYQLDGLAPGRYRLRYGADSNLDVAPAWLGGVEEPEDSPDVIVRSGETTRADIVAARGGRVTGIVRNTDGEPLADAYVQVDDDPNGYRDDIDDRAQNVGRATRTDANGRYEVSGLGPGPYFTSASPDGVYLTGFSAPPAGSSSEVGTYRVAADATTNADVVVKRRGAIDGVVRDEDGRPIAGITVTLTQQWGGIPQPPPYRTIYHATTDADGHYRLDGESVDRAWTGLEFSDPTGIYRTSYWDGADLLETMGHFTVEGETVRTQDHTMTLAPVQLSDPSPVVGQDVEADLENGTAAAARTTWTWQRDGERITNADGDEYRPTPADRGRRLTATASVVRDGHVVSRVSHRSAMVGLARPRLAAAARRTSSGTVVLRITASSRSVAPRLLDGPVQVSRAGRGKTIVLTRTMHDGSLRLVLRGQPQGPHTYRIRFAGVKDRLAASRTIATRVDVR